MINEFQEIRRREKAGSTGDNRDASRNAGDPNYQLNLPLLGSR